ncbi:MAG: YceI family protein [Novosphingobium sp.]
MRRRAGIGSAILAIALMGSAPPAQLRYRIDPKASGVNAQVAFFGLARKTASFPAIMGRLSFPDTPGTITASPIALDVTLDARMLQADDALTLKRLRGQRFFDVEHYPTVTFSGETLRMTAERTADVTGKLTVRGITRPETLHVTFSKAPAAIEGTQPIRLTGTMQIDRRAYGMTAWSIVVGRKVNITIKTRMVPT